MNDASNLLMYDFGDGVTAFSTTRRGGVSKGAYAAFNITHYCGDDAASVACNRVLLCTLLGIDDSRLILPRQTHGSTVLRVDNAFLALGDKERAVALDGVDAVMTNVGGVCIGVSTADCIPVLLYDCVTRSVAAVHAGWRGAVARIAEKAVRAMSDAYNSRPSDVKAVIAPGISLQAFEVGNEVYDAFEQAAFDMPRIALRYGERWHIDLWEAVRQQLLCAGVGRQNIETAGICTYANYDKFFSARRLGISSGRIFNGIMLD